jgi:hypothetical protein
MKENGTAHPSREGKVNIAVRADAEFASAFKEVLARESRKRGYRVTEQEAVLEGIRLYIRKHSPKAAKAGD